MKRNKIVFCATVEKYIVVVERINYNPETGKVFVNSYFFGNNGIRLHRIPYDRVRRTACKLCGTELVEGVNWYNRDVKKNCYTCKKCQLKRDREYNRANVIITTDEKGNNRRIKTIKRLRPTICEFCKKDKEMLYYHHWDDAAPHFGIWVCYSCHKLVELFEDEPTIIDRYNRYNELKRKIESE